MVVFIKSTPYTRVIPRLENPLKMMDGDKIRILEGRGCEDSSDDCGRMKKV